MWCSNCHGVEPLQQATWWSKQAKARVRLPQPYLIKHYNQTMGGVDRMDQNVEKYRISIRSKKWWWPVFMYCIDLAVQQTWHIYRATDAGLRQPLDLLGVRRALVTVLLAQGRTPAVSPGRQEVHEWLAMRGTWNRISIAVIAIDGTSYGISSPMLE
ncbi:piggyBac transposable element-derived protein 3-like [Ruditapes philippinarum]|uniref:piggyBac transposable element-derived protein 3-like n=1 Tax=Ruditapes philippinarum TaxID=129788 RepID=UPI00295B9892|nr:piggyBac transposable element-derived protein 3-like [Ruditapes philippinarum]